MKRWIFLITVFLLSTFEAFAGTDIGNPGDEYSKAFINLGYDLAENIAKDPIPGISAEVLLKAVQQTVLHSEESLTLRGYEVDAINYPDPQNPKIVVSRQGWDRMGTEPHRRAFLVLHEYLSIMGVDDSRYQVSSLLDRAQVCNRTPQVRSAIEQSLKKSCYRIIADDLLYVHSMWLLGVGLTEVKTSDFSGLSNLGELNLQDNAITQVDEAFFSSVPKLKEFFAGTSIPDLADCSRLKASLPHLNQLYVSNTSYQHNATYFHALPHIAPGCFAGLRDLIDLGVSVDGARTELTGFLRGLPARVVVGIDGYNLEKIPATEFANLNIQGVTLTAYDHELPSEFSAAIAKAVGSFSCTKQSNTNRDGTVAYVLSCYR